MSDIALGSHVTFTHRAAVGRRRPRLHEKREVKEWSQWELTEPETRVQSFRAGMPQIMTSVTPIVIALASELVEQNGVSEKSWLKRNKSLFYWPHEGAGVVVGTVRKQYGESIAGHGGSNMYGESDWSPGYFVSYGQLELYVVKTELCGKEIYVPQQFIHLVHP